MDVRLGPTATGFLSTRGFDEFEGECRQSGLEGFDRMATMGNVSEIRRVRDLLLQELNDESTRYVDVFSIPAGGEILVLCIPGM